MHKRVLLDILKSAPAKSSSTLDALPQRSRDILVTVEELIAALYSPQDTSAIKAAVETLAADVTKLKVALLDGKLLVDADDKISTSDVDSLQKKMATVSVNGSTQKKPTDVRKWFDTCFEQVTKLSQTVTSSFGAESSSS